MYVQYNALACGKRIDWSAIFIPLIKKDFAHSDGYELCYYKITYFTVKNCYEFLLLLIVLEHLCLYLFVSEKFWSISFFDLSLFGKGLFVLLSLGKVIVI